MAKYGRVILLIILTAVMIGGLFFLRQRIFGGATTGQIQVSASVVPQSGQCQITVTIDRPQSDVDLSVTVTGKPGISIVKDNAGYESVTRDVGIVFPDEERILDFDCFLDGTTTLHSGAYVVKAVANHRTPKASEGTEFAKGTALLFVELKPDNRNVFLEANDELKSLFVEQFEQGAYYQYGLEVPEEAAPKTGQLHVWISSSKDDYSPALEVAVSGGVAFRERAPAFEGNFVWRVDPSLARIQAHDIDSGGSRIVSVDFSVVNDAIPGSYGIKVLQAERGYNPGEMSPLYIGVETSAETPNERWLNPDPREGAPILTPAPTRD